MVDFDELTALPTLLDALGMPSHHGDPRVTVVGSLTTWRGPFAVDDLAVSSVVAATDAAARLLALRNGNAAGEVTIDARHAAASFLSDAYVEPVGWTIPPVWDPIAGDYQAGDGWIRLHTNYPHHRTAALSALGLGDSPDLERSAIEHAVSSWSAQALETAVVEANGVAARQRSESDWITHPAGVTVRAEPLLARTFTNRPARPTQPLGHAMRPFEGVKVLDLTRVLAGPTATGFLAAWGADVLRIDPPGFPEVAAVLPTTTCGKRCASLNLRTGGGRDRFMELLAGADVVVHGYRSDALHELRIAPNEWHDHRPGLVEVTLDAYGWSGPWTTRRGFDSIVQHSVGITTTGRQALGADRPVPLPCQALDHGAGWLMAAAVARGLAERERTGDGSVTRTSLARVATLLQSLPRTADPERPAPTLEELAAYLETATTAWGPLRRLRWPGTIGGGQPILGHAGPIGSVEPTW